MTAPAHLDLGNKRQRLCPRGPLITDISDEVLADVATYLPKPSRAMFAVAMTAPSSSWRKLEWKRPPSTTSRAIVSLHSQVEGQGQGQCQGQEENEDAKQDEETWAVLDFAAVEYDLAKRLTDDDVGGMLVCIDAVERLKTLKLTGCVGITGRGLEPLSGSAVIEQVDLSLVGKHESPNILWPVPRISETAVIPVLDSIIEHRDKSSLKHLQLPKKFRTDPSPLVDDFVFRYGDGDEGSLGHLGHLAGTCTACCEDLDECERNGWGRYDICCNDWVETDRESPFYGLQNFTCYECTEHRCAYNCVLRCRECEKAFCSDCVEVAECADCRDALCRGCEEFQACADCGNNICESCFSFSRGCCDDVLCKECVSTHTDEHDDD